MIEKCMWCGSQESLHRRRDGMGCNDFDACAERVKRVSRESTAQREGEEKRSAATQDERYAEQLLRNALGPRDGMEHSFAAQTALVYEPPPRSPFDPSPRTLDKAQNGFIMCRVCESVQPAAGHECGKPGLENSPVYVRQDVPLLRSLIKELAGMDDSTIEALYATWSDIGSCAGWLIVDEHSAKGFEEWLYMSQDRGWTKRCLKEMTVRAEYAESLLCAMAFDHGTWRAHEGRLCFTDCALCEAVQ